MDPGVRTLAERQHGLLTTEQARVCGVAGSTLRSWVLDRSLIRLARGLYALPESRGETAESRHLHLARGGLLLMPDAILSHWTALLAHGLPVLGLPPQVRLQRPVGTQVRRHAFIIDPCDCTPVASAYGRAVPVSSAVLQQARSRGVERGLVSADAAIRQRKVSRVELQEGANSFIGPGSSRSMRVADLATGLIESVGESRLRYVCLIGGVEVIPQAVITTRQGTFVGRVDFLVKGTMVILEFDGRLKYQGGSGDGRALWDEKRREDALRALGYTVVRVVWADLADPVSILVRINNAIRSSAALHPRK